MNRSRTTTTGDDRRDRDATMLTTSADTEGADMNDEPDRPNDDEVERDGLAMLGILVLAIVLIVYVGYNVI